MTTKQKLNAILMGLLGSEELVERWWTSPNKAFDDKPPCEADMSKVIDYLYAHGYGGWG